MSLISEINQKMCPACYNLNNKNVLKLFQINLNQAIYMCSNTDRCLYPQGFGLEIIDRDLDQIIPDSDNESDIDDMLLDLISGPDLKDEKKLKIEAKIEQKNTDAVQPDLGNDIDQMALDILERLHDTSQIQDLGTDDLNITLFEASISKEPQPLITNDSALQRLSPKIFQIFNQVGPVKENTFTETNSDNRTIFNSVISLEDGVEILEPVPICDNVLPNLIKQNSVPNNACTMGFINNAFTFLSNSDMKSTDADMEVLDLDIKPVDSDIKQADSPLKSSIKIFSDVRLNHNIDIKSIPFSEDSTTISYVSRSDRPSGDGEFDDEKHVLYDLDTASVVTVKSDTEEHKIESGSAGFGIVKPDLFGFDTVKFDSAGLDTIKHEEVKVTDKIKRTRRKPASANVSIEKPKSRKALFENTTGAKKKRNKIRPRGRPKITKKVDTDFKPPPKKRTRKLPAKNDVKTATILETPKKTTDYVLNLQIVDNQKISKKFTKENVKKKAEPFIASISIPNQPNFTVDLTDQLKTEIASTSISKQSTFTVELTQLSNPKKSGRCKSVNRHFNRANEIREKLRKNGGFDNLRIPMIGGRH